ncbi:MAG: hypothetical protein ACM3O8_10980 [Methylococcaceae bacterium]
MKIKHIPITSATRQVRQQWFSGCIFVLGQLDGLTGKLAAIRPCGGCSNVPCKHKKAQCNESII